MKKFTLTIFLISLVVSVVSILVLEDRISLGFIQDEAQNDQFFAITGMFGIAYILGYTVANIAGFIIRRPFHV